MSIINLINQTKASYKPAPPSTNLPNTSSLYFTTSL